MTTREYLLDVSRLIWRQWSGRLPTGIDRVCLNYVEHFGSSAYAVIQFKGRVLVLTPADSDRLFGLLRSDGAGFRASLMTFLPGAWARSSRYPPKQDMIYLNVGHTGLDRSVLPSWIARARVRPVYLVHDLIPITHPQFCRAGESSKHRLRMRNSLTSAAGIICNSRATLEALQGFACELRLPMPPTTIAWISGPAFPNGVAPTALDRPHFTVIGTVEGRKNHILLLRVWRSLVAEMGQDAPILLIIGQRGWEAEEAISILHAPGELQDHVLELGRSDDQELAGWIAGATALLMPSFVEGFGLPVIEALQLGTPVIAADLPVYREIVGDIPTYLDPADEQSWEDAIKACLSEGPEWARQLRALRGYTPPDWASHFTNVEAWLEELQPASCNAGAVV